MDAGVPQPVGHVAAVFFHEASGSGQPPVCAMTLPSVWVISLHDWAAFVGCATHVQVKRSVLCEQAKEGW